MKQERESAPAETVEKLSVIANQSADWCGDPQEFMVICVFVENVAIIREIPTPV